MPYGIYMSSKYQTDNLNYLRVTLAPSASSFFWISSASSLEAPSLTTLGAPSTTSLASFNPRPVISRTTLITLTLLAPASVSSTSNSVFSSAAAPAAAPAGGRPSGWSDLSATALSDSFSSKNESSSRFQKRTDGMLAVPVPCP